MSYRNIIWLVGRSSRLGSALENTLTHEDGTLIATDIDEVDITKLEEVEAFVEANQPEIIINCVTKSDRLWCEENPQEAIKIHALGPRNLAIAANHVDAHLFHMSSDFVFDGSYSHPYTEFDTPNPLTMYGKSKLAGEEFVRNYCRKNTIFRSSWMYGKRYLQQLIEQARTGKVTYHQNIIGTPTSSLELAETIISFLHTNQFGIFHISCEGAATIKEFIQEVLDITGIEAEIIEGEKPTRFEYLRPYYCVLENLMINIQDIGPMKDWKSALHRFIKERKVVD